jgi:hypothetical protein
MDGITGDGEALDLDGEVLGDGTVGIAGTTGAGEASDGEILGVGITGDGTIGAGEAASDGAVLALVTLGAHHMVTMVSMPTEATPTITVEEVFTTITRLPLTAIERL